MNRQVILRMALVGILCLGIVLGILYREHLTPDALESVIRDLGFWGPVVYIGIYLIAPSLFVPGTVITLVAGALFGPVWGTLYVVLGSVGGSTIAFLVARYLAADWVERKATGILLQVKEGVEAEGWRFVAFVRLVPLFPFNLLNYALGLTRISLPAYVIASAICMFPATVGYVYLGYVGREALVGGEDLIRKIGWGLGIFATLVFIPFLVRRLRANRNKTATAVEKPYTGREDGGKNGSRAE